MLSVWHYIFGATYSYDNISEVQYFQGNKGDALIGANEAAAGTELETAAGLGVCVGREMVG